MSRTSRMVLLAAASLTVALFAAPASAKPAKGKKKPPVQVEKPAEKPEGARVDPRTAPSATEAAGPELGARRGMSRIEFDDRLVQGQTNKANAIYLFERRESALRSLLKKRTAFHEEIDETLEEP